MLFWIDGNFRNFKDYFVKFCFRSRVGFFSSSEDVTDMSPVPLNTTLQLYIFINNKILDKQYILYLGCK